MAENFIQNENIGNNTTATLFAENSHAEKNVLLQTSQAFVSSVNSTSKGQRRVLFDNCSQKCFITNDVKKQLKLPVIKSENLSIKVFGSTKTNLEKLDVVQLKIQSCSSTLGCLIGRMGGTLINFQFFSDPLPSPRTLLRSPSPTPFINFNNLSLTPILKPLSKKNSK